MKCSFDLSFSEFILTVERIETKIKSPKPELRKNEKPHYGYRGMRVSGTRTRSLRSKIAYLNTGRVKLTIDVANVQI